LTPEQSQYWREVIADTPSGWIRSDNAPVLAELCRAMSHAAQIAEELATLRSAKLTGSDEAGKAQRVLFAKLLQMAQAQSQLICQISVKLRFCNQTRTDSIVADRARLRQPTGPRPWDVGKPLKDDGLDS
jgi:hypothetical protein